MKANMRLSYKFTIIFSFEILIKFVKYVLQNHEESQDPTHIQYITYISLYVITFKHPNANQKGKFLDITRIILYTVKI